MSLSKRVQAIKPSPTLAVTARAAKLKAEGRDIIALGTGEPDFDTPQHIKDAAIKAINAGFTKYTAVGGTPSLKTAIIAKLKRDNNLDYTAKQILVSCGGKQSFFNLALAVIDPGDEVIIPAPYWVSYPDIIIIAEGKPVIVHTDITQGFKLTPAQLEAAITPKTRMLVINSPSNPSGAVYTLDDLKALGEVLRQHPNILIATDDMYEHIALTDEKFVNILDACPDLYSRTMVLNGVSKAYSMTGWRIGWAAGPAELISALDMLQSQSVSNASSISQAAALAALQGDQTFIAEWVKIYKHRRDLALKILNAIPGISCRTPGGAFYLYVNCSGMIGRTTPEGKRLETDVDVVMYLLEGVGVALIPGTVYGLSPYFRMSIAASAEVIEDGCRRIERAVTDLA